MTKIEFEGLDVICSRLITSHDMINQKPRTLLYGHTSYNTMWHVYFDGLSIKCVVINGNKVEQVIPEFNSEYIQLKRAYIDCCDYEFCKLLIQSGELITFTDSRTYTERRFYDKTLPDFDGREVFNADHGNGVVLKIIPNYFNDGDGVCMVSNNGTMLIIASEYCVIKETT